MLNILMNDQYLLLHAFLLSSSRGRGDQIPDPFRASGLPLPVDFCA
nr:MAG TPA: hypothetical protein [Caudoviricetes sp.]